MDKEVRKQYKAVIDKGERCRAWWELETTKEFIQYLKDKVAKLKDISFEDITSMDDKSFRSKVESSFLAAKEIEDFFAYIEDTLSGIQNAREALTGEDVEDY